MRLDGSKESGYLTKTSLGVIIAIAVVASLVSWMRDDNRPTVPLDATVTISAQTAPGVVDVRNCDGISERFVFTVQSGRDDEASMQLRDGEKQSDGSCQFRVQSDVIEADSYNLLLNDRLDAADRLLRIDHEDVVRTFDDGDTWLLVFADW